MNADEKICPFCAETIKAVAIRCRYCHADLTAVSAPVVTSPAAITSFSSAAPVSAPSPPTALESGQVLDLLSHLVDKNLVVYEEDEHGQGRYRLLETVRQYGRDRVTESGEEEAGRQRHLTHFLSLAEQAAPHMHRAAQVTWQKRLEPEHDNLRAALEWSLTTPGQDGAALRLVGALGQFWLMGSHVREGGEWTSRALAQGRNAPPLVLARALEGGWVSALAQGDYAAAASLAREAVQFARAAQDRWRIAYALFGVGIVALHPGDLDEAQSSADEGMTLSQQEGDRWLIGRFLFVLGIIAWTRRDYGSARSLIGESMAISRDLADQWFLGMALNNLAYVTRRDGDCDEARALHREGLPLFERLGDRQGIGWQLMGMAGVEAEQGRAERASVLLGAAAAVLEAIGVPRPILAHQREHDRTVEQTQALLGEEAFAAFFAQGRAMSPEQAVAYALEEAEPEP